MFGDPHIVTYDNKIYDYMGDCNYVLSMDCDWGEWVVYGKKERGDTSKWRDANESREIVKLCSPSFLAHRPSGKDYEVTSHFPPPTGNFKQCGPKDLGYPASCLVDVTVF